MRVKGGAMDKHGAGEIEQIKNSKFCEISSTLEGGRLFYILVIIIFRYNQAVDFRLDKRSKIVSVFLF